MSTETSIIGYYDKRAGEYEDIYRKPERQADLEVLRAFVADAFRSADVYEIACGTGYWTEVLARTAASVVAADINEAVLSIARSKNLDSSRVTFINADVYALPKPPRTCNAGLAAFWWSHMPGNDVRSFLSQFHRVLIPGAKVLFIDNCYVEGSSTPLSRTDEDGNTYQLRKLRDGTTHEVRKNFPTEAQLRSAVAPFADEVRVEYQPYYWTLTYLAR